MTVESAGTTAVQLLVPVREHLDQYAAALRRGWSPDNLTPDAAIKRELEEIARDADAYVAAQVDREAKGALITLPDGSQVRRLPGYRLWIWDGEFCGTIGLRWQPGTTDLPPHVLGHVGYAVVPWKRRQGRATAALRLMLGRARGEGLGHVMITTDPGNVASQKVILACGGVLVERFARPAQYGHSEGLRYRVPAPDPGK